MIAFSPLTTFQVRLPAGTDNTSLLHLFVHVRDTFDGIASRNITPVTVLQDPDDDVHVLVNSLVSSSANQSLLLHRFLVEHQNNVDQLLTSLARDLDRIDAVDLQNAVDSEHHFLSACPMSSTSPF